MNTSEFVLCVIGGLGKTVKGRTFLQKTCYFVERLTGGAANLGFKAHFYGPFSPAVDVALNQMVGMGLVEQRTTGFGTTDASGFEMRRIDYELTAQGQEIFEWLKIRHPQDHSSIVEALLKIEAAGSPNYLELSIAAKTFFILKKEKRPLSRDVIMAEAQDLGWKLESQSVNRAVGFLEKLNLVR